MLAQALGRLVHSSPTVRKCLRELQSICGTNMILPASFIPSYRLTISDEPFASGGCGGVYRGTLDGSKVCVKRVRLHAIDDQSKSTKVCSLPIVHCDHPIS